MKKFIVAILAILYVGSSAGATVHMHYCMGKLVDWGLWQHESKDKTCGKCGMEKGKEVDNGCCKDEHKQLKVENDHKAVYGFVFSSLMSTALPVTSYELPLIDLPLIAEENPVSHAPPRSSDIAVYIRNCIFRI